MSLSKNRKRIFLSAILVLISYFVFQKYQYHKDLEYIKLHGGFIVFRESSLPTWLQGFVFDKEVESIELNYSQIESLDFLRSFKRVKKLYLEGVKVSSWRPLQNCIYLEHLNLIRSNFTDFGDLQSYNLKSIIAWDTPVQKLKGIEKFKKLELLSLSSCKVSDLKELGELKALKEFYVKNTAVSDLSPLSSLSSLVKLDISHTNVKSLVPLYNLKSLRSLQIQGLPIKREPTEIYLKQCSVWGFIDDPKIEVIKVKN